MAGPTPADDRPTAARGHSPVFSVIWYGRNRVESARETILALQAQTCANFELIVGDCGSTDGTLGVFQSAAKHDRRIKVLSRWTTRATDALLTALQQCTGEYVGICPSEGHYLPSALEFAATKLAEHPAIGGLCSKGFLVNSHGDSLDHVDIVSLLFTSYRPFLPAGFYRRQALVAVGIDRDGWLSDSIELELCCRLAADYGLSSCQEKLVECRDPWQQADGLVHDIESTLDSSLRLISKIFSRDGFFGSGNEPLALECRANQLSILWEHFRTKGQSEIEYRVVPYLSAVVWGLHLNLRLDHRTLRSLHRLLCLRSRNLGLLSTPLQKLLALTTRMDGRLPIHIGYSVWNFPLWGYWLKRKIIRLTLPESRFHPSAPPRERMFADLYALAGFRYEARGQIDLAIDMWDRARPPDDIDIDSLACQAMLKSPAATDATLAERQKEWVRRHLPERPPVTPIRLAVHSTKIRIGYFCSFMDSDTMRNMMRNVIAAHDRNRFEIYGYSPRPVAADIERAFDVWRLTRAGPSTGGDCYTDEEFAHLMRADGIDVFVELTGFSPGNRFGAMSYRTAPVQVSFLNHTGTSQIPNVDYVLSDEICTPPGTEAQRYYSETIYRLPGCFFCFDYTTSNEPPIVDPPVLKNGYITFGCFGTGGKIGIEQIEIWAHLLRRVPSSTLHIQNPQLSIAENRRFMADRFRRFGIPSSRLLLEGGVDRPTLLQVYARIDICLDTWPYCGGNTIAESLWHGVPVITYKGDRFSSAYGASLVTAAGCADLIAETADQYVNIASRLANDGDRLLHLRRSLRKMSLDHGLGDSKLFACRLEDAFVDMLGRVNRA